GATPSTTTRLWLPATASYSTPLPTRCTRAQPSSVTRSPALTPTPLPPLSRSEIGTAGAGPISAPVPALRLASVMNVLKSTLCAAMLAGCIAGQARAQDCGGTCTTQFEVYLDVVASCSFTGSTDVAFGSVPVIVGQQLDAYGSLTVSCNVPVAYRIGLDAGLHGSGVNDRRMASAGGEFIAYQLYSGATGTTPCTATAGAPWGDASGG